MSPFDILSTITYSKVDVYKNEDENLVDKDYSAYLINRGLSYFPDCILYANEINMCPDIPKIMQYRYLINTIRRAKRFSKWAKKDGGENLTVVMEYFKYNTQKAKQVLSILTDEQIAVIKQKLEKGG